MTAPIATSARPDRVGRALHTLATAFALAGGLVLTALTVLSVASIAKRAVLGRPLPGDFELIEMGCAVAVFAFLPYCHVRGGNVIVDFFTARASAAVKGALDTLGALVYVAIAALLVWRMPLGGIEKYASAEKTMILGLPIWLPFVPIWASLVLLLAVAIHAAWRHARTTGGG
jgi:TRAP-type C4-dicarboxylate transport system permease small subunit